VRPARLPRGQRQPQQQPQCQQQRKRQCPRQDHTPRRRSRPPAAPAGPEPLGRLVLVAYRGLRALASALGRACPEDGTATVDGRSLELTAPGPGAAYRALQQAAAATEALAASGRGAAPEWVAGAAAGWQMARDSVLALLGTPRSYYACVYAAWWGMGRLAQDRRFWAQQRERFRRHGWGEAEGLASLESGGPFRRYHQGALWALLPCCPGAALLPHLPWHRPAARLPGCPGTAAAPAARLPWRCGQQPRPTQGPLAARPPADAPAPPPPPAAGAPACDLMLRLLANRLSRHVLLLDKAPLRGRSQPGYLLRWFPRELGLLLPCADPRQRLACGQHGSERERLRRQLLTRGGTVDEWAAAGATSHQVRAAVPPLRLLLALPRPAAARPTPSC
jgi:hypothetical protein